MVFRAEEVRAFKRLDGFDRAKGHFSPKFRSNAAHRFLVKLLAPEIRDEIARIRDGARRMLNLPGTRLRMGEPQQGEWTLEAPQFGYRISAAQDDPPEQVRIVREWWLREDWTALPREVSSLFPVQAEQMVLPLPPGVNFSQWVTHFERLMRNEGGELRERETEGKLTYQASDGGEMDVDFESGEWRIRPPGIYGFLEMAHWLQRRPEALPA